MSFYKNDTALEIKECLPILPSVNSSTFTILLHITSQHIVYTFKYVTFVREWAGFNNGHSTFSNFYKWLVKSSISVFPRQQLTIIFSRFIFDANKRER